MNTQNGSHLKVQKAMCKTCPFQPDDVLGVRDTLMHRALGDLIPNNPEPTCTPICHSTGKTGFKGDTGKAEKLCRGARNVQLAFFAGIGFIDEATDEAWDRKRRETGC